MTRERAKELWPIIKAYGEGEDIQHRVIDIKTSEKIITHDWYDCGDKIERYIEEISVEYRIKPEPKMRPMTRGEILYMVTTTPAMVLKAPDPLCLVPHCTAVGYQGDAPIEELEWAIIDESGEPADGWHKFEKEVSE